MVRSLRCPPETLATRAANALSTGNGLPLAKVSVMVPAGAASGAPPDLLAPRPLHPAAASTPMSASAGQRHAARPRRAVLRRMLPMNQAPCVIMNPHCDCGPAPGTGSSGLALFPARDIPAIVIA